MPGWPRRGAAGPLRSLWPALALAVVAAWGIAAYAQTPAGKLKGGVAYTLPQWFKLSFLDIPQDMEEARKAGRHLVLFFHLDECPYCARMLEESFARGPARDFMQAHFDVVGVNVRGNLEAKWIDGAIHTERSLARALRIFATPTLTFLGHDGKVALQLPGYRDPDALRHALEYVRSGRYRKEPYTAYLESVRRPAVYALRDHPLFARLTDLSDRTRPLAVLFEDRRCAECPRFHDRTLVHPDVVAEMRRFAFVRLDADSTETIIDTSGRSTTPAQWVRALGLSNRPALVLFDSGREIVRVDGRLYHFHFKETLRYVSGGHYRRYATIAQYNAARREELLKQGVDIDYSE